MSASEWVGRKPEDPKPIVYQGCHESDARQLMKAGINSFCVTYYDIERAGRGDVIDKHPAFLPEGRGFLDSGAFSFLVKGYNDRIPRSSIEKMVPDYLKRYATWVRSKPKAFDFYVTFDYVVEAPVVYKMTKELQKLGIRPVPIYHGDSSIDWLKRYIDDGHQIIGVSKRFFLNDRKNLRKYFDHVFTLTEKSKVAVHGFACTGSEAWQYPYYSIDSTTLVKAAGNGFIEYMDDHGKEHSISITRSTAFSKETMQVIKERGFELEDLKTKRYSRVLFNAITLQQFLAKRNPTEWKRKSLF